MVLPAQSSRGRGAEETPVAAVPHIQNWQHPTPAVTGAPSPLWRGQVITSEGEWKLGVLEVMGAVQLTQVSVTPDTAQLSDTNNNNR